MSEIWKSIEKYPGYEVSNLGRVRSYWHNVYGLQAEPVRILAINRKHYFYVRLAKRSGGADTKLVHCLVAEAFIGPRPDGEVVRHLDGDKYNNMLNNLAYGSTFENAIDSRNNNEQVRGEKVHTSKLTEKEVIEIRQKYSNCKISFRLLAKQYGVSRTTIGDIINGNSWKHVGNISRAYWMKVHIKADNSVIDEHGVRLGTLCK